MAKLKSNTQSDKYKGGYSKAKQYIFSYAFIYAPPKKDPVFM